MSNAMDCDKHWILFFNAKNGSDELECPYCRAEAAEAQLERVRKFAVELAPRYDDGRLYSETKRGTAYDISNELQALLEKE